MCKQAYRILPVSIRGYYKFHVENGAATNRDCYTEIARKVLIYGFQCFCMQRLSEGGYYRSRGYYPVKYGICQYIDHVMLTVDQLAGNTR